jgi:hypothetical protein
MRELPDVLVHRLESSGLTCVLGPAVWLDNQIRYGQSVPSSVPSRRTSALVINATYWLTHITKFRHL